MAPERRSIACHLQGPSVECALRRHLGRHHPPAGGGHAREETRSRRGPGLLAFVKKRGNLDWDGERGFAFVQHVHLRILSAHCSGGRGVLSANSHPGGPTPPASKPRYMPKSRRPRAAPSLRRTRPSASSTPIPAPLSLDESIRNEFRDALKAALAGIAADLERVASRLVTRRPHPLYARPGTPPRTAPAADQVASSAVAAAPLPRACAVIGCRNPVRSLGFCEAHYQKRRLMVATGRLHREWVENAAPHSLPDVILTRKRRAETKKAAPPGEEARLDASPRAWVRKKGQPAAPPPSAQEAPSAPVPRRTPATPPQPQDSTVAATLERWATEFRAGKRRG